MKLVLRSIGILGCILFGGLFAITFSIPDSVEKAGKEFIKYQVEKEVKESIGTERLGDFAEKAEALAHKYQSDIDITKENLINRLPKIIALAIGEMCRMDCDRINEVENSIESIFNERINNLSFAKEKLVRMIKGKYLKIVGNLTMDVRIFLGCNAFIFGLWVLVSFLKPQAIRHLFLPSILLLTATLASASIYLFGQNWFFTIIYDDYMGFTYLAYMAVIFSFLLDVVFNRARITTEIINAFFSAIGSAFSVSPC